MIKKQLGLLAGSVLVASSANAAVSLGGDAVAVFNTAGAGSYYQLVPGATGDSLIAGIEFSMDISAATAALGGSIDSFALLAYGPNDCNGTIDGNECYNYTEFQYIETYNGLIYTGDTAMATTNAAANYETLNIDGYLSNAVMGLNGEGSLGDADGSFVLSRSEEHTSELQSLAYLVCRLLLEKKKKRKKKKKNHTIADDTREYRCKKLDQVNVYRDA